MPNVISSAIVNTPPPDILADVLNKRNKIHHFDKDTEESMIPLFYQGVDEKPRNNKHLLPHRNWCSIREYVPGSTPPPTPPLSAYEVSPSPPARGRITRRLSKTRRPAVQPDAVQESRPPVSGGIFRSFSRRNSSDLEQPGKLSRTLSLGRADFSPRRFFSRRGNKPRDNGATNGQWGPDEEEDYFQPRHAAGGSHQEMHLRGGAGQPEYWTGDEDNFTARPPRRAHTAGDGPVSDVETPDTFVPKPFHRIPTGLSTRQMKRAEHFTVDLEGGLDIHLNVEVNPKDPTGTTTDFYRLLVPQLFYEDDGEEEPVVQEEKGFKRLLSFRKKKQQVPTAPAPAPAPAPTMSLAITPDEQG
jgi:hypothetical protein